MSFTNPSPTARPIFAVSDTNTSGVVTTNFLVPQDIEGMIAKIYLESTWSATGSAVVTIQTTEDGGSTWRDVAATTVGGNIVAATVGNQNAHFIPIPCSLGQARGISNYVGSVAASTLGLGATSGSVVGTVSGLPMMGTLGRVQIAYTGTITTGGINITLLAPYTGRAH